MIERSQRLTYEPAEALAALLDLPLPDLERTGLPLLWHWVYLVDRPRSGDLGPDGHPRDGLPSPPGLGRRRMFAGGTVRRTGPLRLNVLTRRTTQVVSSVRKIGRQGPMTLTTIEHSYVQDESPVIVDRQDIVYLDAKSRPPASAVDDTGETPDGRSVHVDAVLLFRFSALTYNAHRIHYDREYAQQDEGYPDLVVHGPLQALAMATACAVDTEDPVDEFSYRLVAPLYLNHGMRVGADRQPDSPERQARITDGRGRLTASAIWRPRRSDS